MDYIPIRIILDYSYSLGELKPYFDTLRNGEALGSKCPECQKVHFPPRLICEDDGTSTEWHQLEGTGTITEITTQANGESFALIAMDGASNKALGHLTQSSVKPGDRVKITQYDPEAEHPANCVVYTLVN